MIWFTRASCESPKLSTSVVVVVVRCESKAHNACSRQGPARNWSRCRRGVPRRGWWRRWGKVRAEKAVKVAVRPCSPDIRESWHDVHREGLGCCHYNRTCLPTAYLCCRCAGCADHSAGCCRKNRAGFLEGNGASDFVANCARGFLGGICAYVVAMIGRRGHHRVASRELGSKCPPR